MNPGGKPANQAPTAGRKATALPIGVGTGCAAPLANLAKRMGVRPACWRFRATRRAPKREQAPRTPCASRHSVAALPALPCWEISVRSKLLRPIPGPISHLFSWRRNQVVLVHLGLLQQELVAVGPNNFCAVHLAGAAQTEVQSIGRFRAVRIACDKLTDEAMGREMQPDRDPDWRTPTASLTKTKSNPVAGVILHASFSGQLPTW